MGRSNFLSSLILEELKMFKDIKMGAVTVDKIIAVAEGLKGFRKHRLGVVKALAGKYAKAGEKIKAEGSSSAELVRQIRSQV